MRAIASVPLILIKGWGRPADKNYTRGLCFANRSEDCGLMNELKAAAIILALSISSASAQDVAAGEISFSRCLGCHAIGPNAKNKIGPQLNGIEARKCGSVEEYSYSAANKDCAFTWNETDFVEYIRDPKAKIPGTKKSISGIKDQSEARNLWTYLRQFGPDGRPK
jgi:cytochrome c